MNKRKRMARLKHRKKLRKMWAKAGATRAKQQPQPARAGR